MYRNYDLTIKRAYLAPDGVNKSMIVINGVYPGVSPTVLYLTPEAQLILSIANARSELGIFPQNFKGKR